MPSITGKMAELDDVSFIPGLMGARGSTLRYSRFVPLPLCLDGTLHVP